MNLIYKTNTNNGIELTLQPMSEHSVVVELNPKYVTLEAERVVAMNKMQLAIHVMRNIISDSSIEPNEQTSVFKSVMLSFGLTKAGIYTYARNVRNHLNGGDAYESNKKWNKKRADELRVHKAEQAAEIEKKVINLDLRWGVVDAETKALIDTFTSRQLAQEYNKSQQVQGKKTRWIDRQKTA